MVVAFGCKTVYLQTEGEVIDFNEDSVTIIFPCHDVKRPDCWAYSVFSREKLPFPYVGQKVEIKPTYK